MLRKTVGDNAEVLFHHRRSTSTIDIRNACHPFSTKEHFDYQYVGIHNGVVRNSRDLRKTHEEMGITYTSIQQDDTFNDSEALIYDLARYFEGQVDKITAAGSVAFVVVKRDKQGKPMTLFFGHNSGNPLVMKKTEHSLTVASTGEGDPVPVNELHIFDYETNELRTTTMYVPSYYQQPQTYAPYIPTKSDLEDDDYFNKRYNIPNSSSIDTQVRKGLEDELIMRVGDKEEVKQAILDDNFGRKAAAAAEAILELSDAEQEKSLMDTWISHEEDEDTMVDIVQYWVDVNAYAEMLGEIVDELNQEAREETPAKQPFGFHPKPISRKDNKLLPSTIVKNNNKSK